MSVDGRPLFNMRGREHDDLAEDLARFQREAGMIAVTKFQLPHAGQQVDVLARIEEVRGLAKHARAVREVGEFLASIRYDDKHTAQRERDARAAIAEAAAK